MTRRKPSRDLRKGRRTTVYFAPRRTQRTWYDGQMKYTAMLFDDDCARAVLKHHLYMIADRKLTSERR